MGSDDYLYTRCFQVCYVNPQGFIMRLQIKQYNSILLWAVTTEISIIIIS